MNPTMLQIDLTAWWTNKALKGEGNKKVRFWNCLARFRINPKRSTYHVANRSFVNSCQRLQRLQEQIRVLWPANDVDKVAQLFRHHQQHFVFIIQ